MRADDLNRREFLKITGAGAGSLLLAPACSQTGGKWRFFTDAEALVVAAITEQIVPTDEDAGAIEANVINYLDTQLTGFFSKYQQIYRRGIAGVQQTSMRIFNSKFETLEWEQQTDILRKLETNTAEDDIWQNESAPDFFELIRDHTMQGFYGSPRHGGNRRYASFKMLGLDYPRIVGQNRYKLLPGALKSFKK
jgi:gluconate 2-dehydrogenase gamma chain